MTIVERHLGLIPSNEAEAARARIDEIAALVAAQVDLDALLARRPAACRRCLRGAPVPAPARPAVRRCAWASRAMPRSASTIRAISRPCASRARSWCAFDALHDERLPPMDGLFIGGGFPETHMDALAANTQPARRPARRDRSRPAGLRRMRRADVPRARHRVERAPRDDGRRGPGRHRHARAPGRARLRAPARDRAQPVAAPPRRIRSRSARTSSTTRASRTSRPDVAFAYEVERGHGIDGRHDGIVHKNLLASYAHLRDVAGNPWARRFVDFVRHCRSTAPWLHQPSLNGQ